MPRRRATTRTVLRAGVRMYRALLRLFPADFRVEWCPDMDALFTRRSVRALRDRDMRGLLGWWFRSGADLGRSLFVEWAERAGRGGGPLRAGIREPVEDLLQEVRFALRRFARTPLWTATALATLVVGIGGVTGMFSLVYDNLIRPLPFEAPELLVALRAEPVDRPDQGRRFSLPLIEAWEAEAPAGVTVGGYAPTMVPLGLEEGPRYVPAAYATGNLFDVLGIRPILGRAFEADDAAEGAVPVVALGEAMWRDRFGADPSVLGRTVELGETAYTVVAVVGPELDVLVPGARLWIPPNFPRSPDITVLSGFGRMPPSTPIVHVREALSASPVRDPSGKAYIGRIEPLQRSLVGDVRPVLLTFMALVTGLLLIASVNLANLLLVRASALDEERGVREALGASRGRLLLQNVVDGLLLAGVGGAGGLLLGTWLRHLVLAWTPSVGTIAGSTPMAGAATPNAGPGGVEGAFALLLAAALCTSLAIWSAGRARAPGSLVDPSGSRGSQGRRLRVSQRVLMVVQVTAAFVLLTGSTLLLRNVLRLTAAEPGFATGTAGGIFMTLPAAAYPDAAARKAVIRRLAGRIDAVPGVTRAAAVDRPPLRGYATGRLEVEGMRQAGEGSIYSARVNADVGFFEAMGIPLVRGRPFDRSDVEGAPEVAVVSGAFVRRHLPPGDPLGRRIRFRGDGQPWRTIVGVTGDVRLRGPAHDTDAVVFEPLPQTGAWSTFLPVVFRTRGPAASVSGAVRAALREVAPQARLVEVGGFDAMLRHAPGYAEARFRALVSGLLGAVALLLSLVGVYGVAAYRVRRRTREFGIRIALGAGSARMAWSVVREGLLLTLLGVGIGATLAWPAAGLIGPFLQDVHARDAGTFAAVALLLGLAAVLASLLPALIGVLHRARGGPQGRRLISGMQ